jgi:hypothetical protein
MASNQIKHNVETGTAMTKSFIEMGWTLSNEATIAFENARKEMMASAKRVRNDMIASAERMKKEGLRGKKHIISRKGVQQSIRRFHIDS